MWLLTGPLWANSNPIGGSKLQTLISIVLMLALVLLENGDLQQAGYLSHFFSLGDSE